MRIEATAMMSQAATAAPVPECYRGVWRRTLLETPDMRDTTTTVLWLQTAQWHADIRIPAQRPDFSATRSLAECSPSQLAWLARQQGFAGITHVEQTAAQETCTWHRVIDYQPPRSVPDAGFMKFERARLIETGVHADYLENWSSLPKSGNGFAVLQKITPEHNPAQPMELLMVAGDYVMHVRSREGSWPEAMPPDADLTQLVGPRETALLDFEISFGRRTARGWRITYSTLPWIEGKSIDLRMTHVAEGRVEISSAASSALWNILEWQPPVT